MQRTENKMKKSIQDLNQYFKNIRLGRANPQIIENIKAVYYDALTPIPQIASITVLDAKTLVIKPYDISSLQDIFKAIQKSDIGLNVNNDGTVLKIVFPPLSEERRKEVIKDIKKRGEEAKISIRVVRRDSLDQGKAKKKKGEITEDEVKSFENKVQKLTDKYIKEIETLVSQKENEVSKI